MARLDEIEIDGTSYELVPEIAPLFNTSTQYSTGDYVIKDAVLYRFKTAHVSGAWSASQVDEVTAGSELKSIKNDKLDKNQGTANAGKYLKVGADGDVETADLDITTDKTLSIADKAADAKAVGDEITSLKADLSQIEDLFVEPVEGITQLVDPSTVDWRKLSSKYRAYVSKIPLGNDGCYYPNPYAETSSDINKTYYDVNFFDAYDNKLTLTKQSDGSTTTFLNLFNTYGAYIEIENKRTLYLYVRGSRGATYVASADIAYMGGSQAYFGYWTAEEYDGTQKIGVTYGRFSKTYVSYSEKPEWGYSSRLKNQINEQVDAKLDDTFNTASATSEDVGKTIVVETVDAEGNVTFDFGEAGGGSNITVPTYDAAKTYPVGSYVMYDGGMYRSNVPITTAEAWNSAHWTAITVSDLIADMNERLDMVVTMQEVQEDEPVEGVVQIVDWSSLVWSGSGVGKCTAKTNQMIPLHGDGPYYQNPYGVSVNTAGAWTFYYATFYDAYGNNLTLTKEGTGTTHQYVTMFGASENNGHFEIVNGRTLKYYRKGTTLSDTYTTDSNIAYLGRSQFSYFDNYDTKFGLTYGGYSSNYVPYQGKSEPTYEYNYVPKMAEYVEKYMKEHGTAVDNNMFNYVYPETNNSEFVNAVKYYNQRSERQFDDVIRVANFNKYISRGSGNWRVIKQELADYSIDICGFEETAFITDGSGTITNRIENALQSWQFPYGSNHTVETGKALVSQWEVISTDVLPLIVTSDRGTNYAIRSKINLYPYKWYSNAVSNICTLSVYVYHGIAYNATIDGTMYSTLRLHEMEISALLTALASDTSDFKIIVSDTNAFEDGYDVATGTHAEWELFRNAGYTPVLEGYESTVTANLASKYFAKASNGKVYCLADYDQIFIGSNIEIFGSDVVDSNLYPIESAGGVPVSDHCMVYADLKFDFDAVMQEKLDAIAITEPWW